MTKGIFSRLPAAATATIARMWAISRRSFWGGCAVVLVAALSSVRAGNEPANDFRFSILGDRTGEAEPEVYGRVWRGLDMLHPDFVINVGDTIQGGNDATAEAEWRALRPLWERYKYPLYFTPGNHDIWSPRSRAIYERETGHPASYGFNYQNAHFTVLDNSETESLSPEQMNFLARDLAENKDREPKFVLFHKPFWLIPVKFQSSQFPFHQLAKKYGVRYVISGHGHEFVRALDDGIVYIEAGSSGGKLKGRGFAGGWFFGQIYTRVKGLKVDMTVKEIDGPMGKGRMFRIEDWGDNGPKFDPNDPAAIERPST
jgi:predicted phosphodiesterase